MSDRPASRLVALRFALLLGIASGATFSSAPSAAQTAPNPLTTPVLGTGAGAGGGAAISIDPAAGQARIDLAGSNRLVQWDSFNVGGNATVAFSDSSGVAGHLSVLNTVNAANGLSQIYGRITADPKISVWLANPSGILFGGSGGFSGGSLVLTTAQIGAADQARFDRTAPDSLAGTIQLGGMSADLTKGVTLGTQTSLAVTGGVVIAGQVVKVAGTITASGDVVLVAAETATVPLDLGSPIAVTINRGATVGSARLGASGTITAANITLGAAAASGYDMLLSVDSGAVLTATATSGGRVVIAAGRTSGENGTAGGTPAVTLAPVAAGDTGGSARLTSVGALTAVGRAWLGASGDLIVSAGSLTTLEATPNALTLDAFGNLTVAADLIAAHGAVALTAGFAGSLSGRIEAGTAAGDPGGIAISAYSGLTLGRADGMAQVIQTTGSVALSTSMGLISTQGAAQITAGRLGGSAADIAIRQGVTADLALGKATLIAGADAGGASNHVGTVTLQTSGPTLESTGNVTVQSIDAGTLVLSLGGGSQLTGTFTADHVVTQGPLAIRSTAGSLRINEAESLSGSVSLMSDTGDISGTAATASLDGRLLPGYDRLSLTAGGVNAVATVTAGQSVQLGSVMAGASGATSTSLNQVVIRAAAIDVVTLQAINGNAALIAGTGGLRLGTGTAGGGFTFANPDGTTSAGLVSAGDAQIGSAEAKTGDLQLQVPGALSGLLMPGMGYESAADGLAIGTLNSTRGVSVTGAGDVRLDSVSVTGASVSQPLQPTVTAGGSVRLGSLMSDGTVNVKAALSVTGVPVTPLPTNTGAMLTADLGAVRLPGSAAQGAGAVAVLGIVRAGGDVSLAAGRLSAGSVTGGGAVTLAGGTGLSVGSVGGAGAVISTSTAGMIAPDSGTLVVDANGLLRPGYGAANVQTTSLTANLSVTATAGVAQLGTVKAGMIGAPLAGQQVTIGGQAVVIDTVIAPAASLAITASAGDLALGTGGASIGDAAQLTKTGTAGEIRLSGTLVTGVGGLPATLVAGSDTMPGSGGVLATSSTDLRGTSITSRTGAIAVTAAGSVSGLADATASLDGRLLPGYDRLSLTAGGVNAVATVTAGQSVQLGSVMAGASGATSTSLNQVVIRAAAIDVVTLQAINGNAALIAGTGGLRLGTGTAGGGFTFANPDGTTSAGLVSAGDAQIGSAEAKTGDLQLQVPGALSGLLMPGMGYESAADGLAIGTLNSTRGVSVTGAGDVRLDSVSVTGASVSQPLQPTVTAGGSVRLGSLMSDGTVNVKAALSVTGVPVTPLPTNTGAMLTADLGAVRLPGSAAQGAGAVAVLGIVRAGGDVSLAAGRLSAGSVTGGGAVTLAGGTGLSVGSVGGAGAVISTSTAGMIAPDSGTLVVDANGLLRPGYGAANVQTTSLTANLSVTATAGVAQLGTVKAGMIGAPLAGQQVTIGGQAVVIDTVIAPAASLAITASAGDLALGTGGASIGDAAQLTKTGTAGEIRLSGTLVTGVGGLPATLVAGSDTMPGSGGVLATSSTDLRGTSITSRTGAIAVTAAGSVSGLADATASLDGRLLPGYDRLSLTAGGVNAVATVTAGQSVQLGSVMAGASGATSTSLNQVVIRAAAIDVVTLQAINGNAALIAGTGGLRLGTGTAGGGFTFANPDGTTSAGLVSAGDAQIGSAEAKTGDLQLQVPGALSGLLMPGMGYESAADGLAIGTLNSTRGVSVTGAGDVRLDSVSVTGASVSQPLQPTVTAGGSVRLGSLMSDGTVNVKAALSVTGVPVTPLPTNTGAMLTADLGAVRLPGSAAQGAGAVAVLGIVRAGGDVSLAAGRLSAGSVTGGGAVTLAGGTGLSVGSVGGAGAVISTSTAGMIAPDSGTLVVDANGLLRPGYGAANVQTTSLTANLSVTATAGVAQLGTVKAGMIGAPLAGQQVTIGGQAVVIDTVIAPAASLAITASAGDLALGTGSSGGAATVTKTGAAGDISIGTLTAGTSASLISATAVRVDQVTANGRTTATNTADLLVTAAADVSGRAGGRAGLTASAAGANIGVTATGAATLGTVVAANSVTATAASIDVTAAKATAGTLSLTANAGALALGTGSSGGAATVTKTGAAGDISVGTLTAGTSASLISATSVRVDQVTANGRTTATNTADLLVTAAADVSGRAGGRAGLTASAAGANIGVTATGAATLGTVVAANSVTATAASIDVTAAKATAGTLSLTANAGALALGTGSSGLASVLVKTGTTGKMTIGTLTAGSALAPSQIMLMTATDLDIGPAGIISAANGQITIDQTAGTGIGLGYDNAKAPLAFNLSPAEVNLIVAPTVKFQAHGGPVSLGTVAFNTAGTSTLDLFTTGAITVSGAVSGGGGTDRVLQLGGGTTGEGPQANTVSLAASLIGNLETGASINWSGIVDLRAQKIMFGDAVLRGTVGGQSGVAVASNFVSNPSSPLYYTASGSGQTFLTANRLFVRYGDYALFQNTGATSAINAGLKLGPDGNSTNTIALVLDGPGDNGANAFALFGTINGFVARSAGLLPETVIDFATGTAPRVLRITQSNSRVNGCVIGSPDRGCLNIDTPPPTLKLFDERYLLLFDTNQAAEVSFDPLIATNNEALLGELATGPDQGTSANCSTSSADPRCPASARKER